MLTNPIISDNVKRGIYNICRNYFFLMFFYCLLYNKGYNNEDGYSTDKTNEIKDSEHKLDLCGIRSDHRVISEGQSSQIYSGSAHRHNGVEL